MRHLYSIGSRWNGNSNALFVRDQCCSHRPQLCGPTERQSNQIQTKLDSTSAQHNSSTRYSRSKKSFEVFDVLSSAQGHERYISA